MAWAHNIHFLPDIVTFKMDRLLLPGFGRPLNYVPKEGDPDYTGPLFPSALSSLAIETGNVAQEMVTLRELSMLKFMDNVTDKSDWHLKVNDDEIAKKWKEEACASEDLDITPACIDWCIEELRYKATPISKSPANPPPIVVYQANVVKSDTAVSSELRLSLQEAVNKFEAGIPERLKDWHPGSDDKVWDLVHPSLFPLIYGRSRVLENGETTTLDDCIQRCGQGRIANVAPTEEIDEASRNGHSSFSVDQVYHPFSNKFQWLPCEVDISRENTRITTYINNLHPVKEKPLYELIQKLIDASIPLWETTLAPLTDPDFRHSRRIVYDDCPCYDPDPGSLPETEGPQQGTDEDEDDYWDRRQEWIENTRQVIRPEPEGTFQPVNEPEPLSFKEKWGKRGLQVIVKLANIELTPEKPEYAGGSWHVEGQMNEHIVATALYYYSCENITKSTLSFRHQVDPEEAADIPYEQNVHDWLTDIFGCEQEGSCVQELGDVETREGRLLTFPNILQHRVGHFKLADPTKSGHRKIVALFLVDPNIKVISTAHVPCQQQEWWWEMVMAKDGNSSVGSATAAGSSKKAPLVGEIPIELQDNILDGVDFPISLEEAKALRLDLMEERKAFVVQNDKAFAESATFSLCEH